MTHRKYNTNQSMTDCSHTEVFPGTKQKTRVIILRCWFRIYESAYRPILVRRAAY